MIDKIKLAGGPKDGHVLDITSPRGPHLTFDDETGKITHHYGYKVQANKYVYMGSGPKGKPLLRKRKKQI